MNSAILLIDTKYPHNVGGALRACACFEADILRWTGKRVDIERIKENGDRLPREERIKDYQLVDWAHTDSLRPVSDLESQGYTPVCVEVLPSSEDLRLFEHPEKAVYIFGPEDGDIPKGIKNVCHRFVTIPTVGCLNLAVAVNLILYDRLIKVGRNNGRI